VPGVRLEDIPTVLGGLVALFGLWLLWDALLADRVPPLRRERRRRARADRDRLGEAGLGLGTLCLAAALVGRDTWRYGTVAVLAGTILLIGGAALNFRFLRELLLFAGPARRQEERAPRGAEADRYAAGRDDAPAVTPAPEAVTGARPGAPKPDDPDGGRMRIR
jgi:hypothetical protein